MAYEKEKLYRKENKVSLSCKYYVNTGSEFRYERNTKQMSNFEGNKKSMKKGQYGYDYTPLYKFLLSKVGKVWDDVFSEAKSRLDKTEPIYHIVELYPENDPRPYRILGEASYYSTLIIDDNGLLQKLDKDYIHTDLGCSCCTHSFNGNRILNGKIS